MIQTKLIQSYGHHVKSINYLINEFILANKHLEIIDIKYTCNFEKYPKYLKRDPSSFYTALIIYKTPNKVMVFYIKLKLWFKNKRIIY